MSALALARRDDELGRLATLESEAVHVMRGLAADVVRPVLLFSGGKDSSRARTLKAVVAGIAASRVSEQG